MDRIDILNQKKSCKSSLNKCYIRGVRFQAGSRVFTTDTRHLSASVTTFTLLLLDGLRLK